MKILAVFSLSLIASAAAAAVGTRSDSVEKIAFAVPGGAVFTTITQSPQSLPTAPTDAQSGASDSPEIAHAAADTYQAYTTIRTAFALPTILPGRPPMFIHPFSYQITQSCTNGFKHVSGTWRNGDFELTMDLAPGYTYQMDPRGGFPTFTVGEFDHSTDTLHFSYRNGEFRCDWSDDEFWKTCGECRAGTWDGPALECTIGGGGGIRVSETR
jgi:hypothetical protein